MVLVTGARHLGGFRLGLEFDDGTSGEVDLESRLYGAVKRGTTEAAEP